MLKQFLKYISSRLPAAVTNGAGSGCLVCHSQEKALHGQLLLFRVTIIYVILSTASALDVMVLTFRSLLVRWVLLFSHFMEFSKMR